MQNPAKTLPEYPKQGMQQSAGGFLPGEDAQSHSRKVGDPNISGADPEGQLKPSEEYRPQKNQVGNRREPGPKGPQKAIYDSQDCADQKCCSEPLGSQCRSGHPNRRPSQLPEARVSS